MALEVSSGNVHDSQMFEGVVMRMRLHNGSRGRPRTRPKEVAADKAYDSSYIRQYLRDREKPTLLVGEGSLQGEGLTGLTERGILQPEVVWRGSLGGSRASIGLPSVMSVR